MAGYATAPAPKPSKVCNQGPFARARRINGQPLGNQQQAAWAAALASRAELLPGEPAAARIR